MFAFICDATRKPTSTESLQIKGEINFLIEPVQAYAMLRVVPGKDEWYLTFFRGSVFERSLSVYLQKNSEFRLPRLARVALFHSLTEANEEELRAKASQFVRATDALTLNGASLLTKGRSLLMDRVACVYFSRDEDQFQRIVVCMALASAYGQVLRTCLKQMTSHIKDDATDKILALYEDILKFNAADYFSLPVELEKHELAAAWRSIHAHYRLRELNQELTEQLSGVASLLSAKREREAQLLEKAQQELLRANEAALVKREKKLSGRIGWLSLFIALLSLGSLFQITPLQVKQFYEGWFGTPEAKEVHKVDDAQAAPQPVQRKRLGRGSH